MNANVRGSIIYNVEIDGLDKELVLELLENQENERLYKYIIITEVRISMKCLNS